MATVSDAVTQCRLKWPFLVTFLGSTCATHTVLLRTPSERALSVRWRSACGGRTVLNEKEITSNQNPYVLSDFSLLLLNHEVGLDVCWGNHMGAMRDERGAQCCIWIIPEQK